MHLPILEMSCATISKAPGKPFPSTVISIQHAIAYFVVWATNGKTGLPLVKATPQDILFPENEAEIQEIVRKAQAEGRKIRVVGAGHSFTPLIKTDSIILSLDKLSGIISVDKAEGEAVVWAGTRLKALGEMLHAQGLAMENLGDIDVQSIAGALSTGTHGCGIDFGILATQMISCTIVTASGELLELDARRDPERFKAAQVALGTLGIITRMGLRLDPAYKLKYEARKETFDQVLENLEQYKQENRNFEFYWFPYTETVQTKFINKTDDAPKKGGFGKWLNDIVLENGVFWVISRISRHLPGTFKAMSRLSAWGVSASTKTAWSHQVFATKRLVRFQEMEYNLPADQFPAALREIKEAIETFSFKVHFPLECRFVKGDDIWISPAHGRDSAYIAVHSYKGMPYKEYFGAMEAIFKKYNGRPHWGKMHNRTAEELKELYPKWEDFQNLRRELDPTGIFLNGYMKEVFGGAPA